MLSPIIPQFLQLFECLDNVTFPTNIYTLHYDPERNYKDFINTGSQRGPYNLTITTIWEELCQSVFFIDEKSGGKFLKFNYDHPYWKNWGFLYFLCELIAVSLTINVKIPYYLPTSLLIAMSNDIESHAFYHGLYDPTSFIALSKCEFTKLNDEINVFDEPSSVEDAISYLIASENENEALKTKSIATILKTSLNNIIDAYYDHALLLSKLTISELNFNVFITNIRVIDSVSEFLRDTDIELVDGWTISSDLSSDSNSNTNENSNENSNENTNQNTNQTKKNLIYNQCKNNLIKMISMMNPNELISFSKFVTGLNSSGMNIYIYTDSRIKVAACNKKIYIPYLMLKNDESINRLRAIMTTNDLYLIETD